MKAINATDIQYGFTANPTTYGAYCLHLNVWRMDLHFSHLEILSQNAIQAAHRSECWLEPLDIRSTQMLWISTWKMGGAGSNALQTGTHYIHGQVALLTAINTATSHKCLQLERQTHNKISISGRNFNEKLPLKFMNEIHFMNDTL